MASRKPEDMHPWLLTRWNRAVAEWKIKHPTGPQPFLTCTYRSPEEQTSLYAQGRTKPGSKVTNARAGQSLHNYYPSYAFDIGFHGTNGKVDWNILLFKEFAEIIKAYGVVWGGDWKNLRDNPHFEVPNFTWKDAKDGKKPILPD